MGGRHTINALYRNIQNEAAKRAPGRGLQSREVIALYATGHLSIAPWGIQLTVVTHKPADLHFSV